MRVPAGTFGEADIASWEREDSDVYRLTLPPDAPAGDVFPDLETALLSAADQLQRAPSSPELPRVADHYRRAR